MNGLVAAREGRHTLRRIPARRRRTGLLWVGAELGYELLRSQPRLVDMRDGRPAGGTGTGGNCEPLFGKGFPRFGDRPRGVLFAPLLPKCFPAQQPGVPYREP